MSSSHIPLVPINSVGTILYGGLGNRLFQAASMYSISKDINKELIIVYNAVNPHTTQDYTKSIFRKIKSDHSVAPYFLWSIDYMKQTGLSEEYIKDCWNIHKNHNNYSHPEHYRYEFVELPKDIKEKELLYMDGYMMNKKYFDHRREEILELFEPTVEMLEYLKNLVEASSEGILKNTNLWTRDSKNSVTNSVALHIRILDNGNYELTSQMEEHYNKATDKMIELYGEDINFYIFSNRLPTEKEAPYLNKIKNKHYVTEDELTSLYIMSMCSLGCINYDSTFSWWGNYLNKNINKVFISANNNY